MSAKKLLDLLEQSDLLDKALLAELRDQLKEQKNTAAAVAKRLVDKGLLTKFQATNFVSEAVADRELDGNEQQPDSEPDELSLAPIEDDPEEEQRIREAVAAAAAGREKRKQDEEVILLEDAGDALTPVEDAGAGLTPVGDLMEASPLAPLDSGLDDLFSEGGDLLGDFSAPPPRPVKRRLPVNVWDSKLMFGGGLALALLVILFVVLFVNLAKTPAIDTWEAAMQDYRTGSFTQALVKFDAFLEDYPDDENASEGRVRAALCRIRLAVSDPQKGFDRATELLPTIESEAAFSVAREELATVLIQIPDRFARRAKSTEEMEEKELLVARAEAGMELVNNPSYVPSSQRNAIRNDVNRVLEGISVVHRAIDQDRDLASAIVEIDEAAESEETSRAFQVYKDLVKKYPGLATDSSLIESVKRITARQKELVAVVNAHVAAQAGEPDQIGEARVVLASPTVAGKSPAEQQVAGIRHGGSVYGVDAGTGRVLWSRFVGYGLNSPIKRVSSESSADLLIIDTQEPALQLRQATTGQLVWRFPLDEAVLGTTVTSRSIYVSTKSGTVWEIDSNTGESQRRVEIPQQLTSSAAVASAHPLMFQAGSHSALYVFSTETLECVDVFYLGHKSGTIRVAPFVHRGHVLLAENVGRDHSQLRVLKVEVTDGASTVREAQPPIPLDGHVIVPMHLHGRRVLVVTDRGAVKLFDVDLNRDRPVNAAASLAATLDEPLLGHPLSDAESLWIASDRLTRYDVQVTTKEISRQEIMNVGDVFVSRPQVFRDVLVHARQPKSSAGVTVTAVSVDKPRVPLWATQLSSPLAYLGVNSDRDSIRAITTNAHLFEITPEEIQQGFDGLPTSTARSLTRSVLVSGYMSLGDGRIVLYSSASGRQLLLYEPASEGSLQLVDVEALADTALTCAPVACGGNAVLPLENGEVAFHELDGGEHCRSFRPRIEPGETVRWIRPVALSDREFVIADDRRQIFRVEKKEMPFPHLAQAAVRELEFDLVASLAGAGKFIFGVRRSGGPDDLVVFDALTLEIVGTHELTGERVTWGPERIGEAVLIVTDDQHVHCFGNDSEPHWPRAAVAHGRPAGPPIVQGEDFIFASHNGSVWRIAIDFGDEVGRTNTSERLASGPVAFDQRILVATSDGAVLRIPNP